jgi:hypothetical protein
MKPTRTENNKSPKSGAIRKWSLPKEEIKNLAKELTKVPEVIQEVKVPDIKCNHKSPRTSWPIEEVQAPAIEPVFSWNYEVYAWYIQAHIDEHETYTESVETLKKLFPQNKTVRNIAQNLKRTYWLDYRHSDANGWEYVFFDGETKDETIDRLRWEIISNEITTKHIKNTLKTIQNANNQTYTTLSELEKLHTRLKEEKHDLQKQLKSKQSSLNTIAIISLLMLIYALINLYLQHNWL